MIFNYFKKFDVLIVLITLALFYLSHQIYCQNDQGMLVYRVVENNGINWLRASCIDGLDFTSVRDWLPDAIWSFLIAMSLSRIWHSELHRLWVKVIIVLSGIGFELMQFFELAKGTFDSIDLVVSFVSSIFAIYFVSFGFRKTDE